MVGILHSFMEFHIDGVESGEEKGEDQTADTERGENSHVAGNVDGTADVSGRNKRKHADRGAESRKKNVLCHLAASSKGNIDTDMKNFLEDLVQASFTTFGEKFCQQFSDRLGKIETEVTQLRTASERTEQFELSCTTSPRGLLYEMSIHELCILFEFQTRHEACSLPKFPCAYLLWSKIADSSYVSREAKLAMLRNPVLRVVAKYLGHLLLGKSEAGSLTEDEAQLIHYGLPLALRPTYDVADEPPAELSVNMGALFAQMFLGVFVLLTGSLWMSLLAFFLNTKILHSGKIYRFTMPDGTILHCKLPQPAITSLTSVENMEFMPPAEVLYTPPPPASKRRRGSSSSGPAQTQCEDDTIADISYLLPPYTGLFDSGAPPLDGTQQQQFAWTADTLVKLSTMMQTVWGALAKIRCPPTPSCCRAPKTSEAAGMTRDDAGNEPSDEATDERGSRLHRSRRAPEQSRSCSPDDHQCLVSVISFHCIPPVF
ncbi:hypothetical protein HID58_055716 [Brassica napus]|uniref:Arabidopsis retrotransposon Orf1 C-terminal domain-containing protein n=1 Tax=Brassica napus TaxID=3708 RepID=A0ABQ8AM12_BRANA|nr:hypothetical protein HID58_055716 [Brassica napus]